MHAALLINDRVLRTRLTACAPLADGTVEPYPTAAKALAPLLARRYDVIVLHWKVHPGFASGDDRIEELAYLLPRTKLNQNVLYWEVGLRILDLLREEESANRTTPVCVIFPPLGRFTFETGDALSRESVEGDLATRQPAHAIFGLK